ncbi:MAG: UvrD-helicase domain-containing protein [Bdellovibrionia bacterium]
MSTSRNDISHPQFSPEQQEVIGSWGQGMAVLAGAGSGKTTTLVAKCAQLLERNSKAKFAAVSFTERSASDLRAKLSLALAGKYGASPLTLHWVMTIHGLCRSIIKEFPKEAGFDGEETVLSESEASLLWERAMDSLWLEDLPDDVRVCLEALLDRESRDSLAGLLERVRRLVAFGALSSLKDSEDVSSQNLFRVARYVLERYDRMKRRQGRLDFDDLERGADRALEFDTVRDAYHRRFDLVLVDEFQDTNPVQSRIIWRFIKVDLSNVCVVGDPKQSIYRFRDADVTVFEEFCNKLPLKFSLTWNFRSRPDVIEFANQVCARAFASSEMAFEALVPKREPDPTLESVVRFDIQSPSDLGDWIQAEVRRGIPLHNFALLIRKIRGNEKWFKALTAARIPIAIGSGGLFWEDPRVREMVAFLKWWDNSGNTFSGGVFLRAPWMQISDETLDLWNKQDVTWRAPFFSSPHPIAGRLKPLLNLAVRPGELLMALLVDQETEDELGGPLLGLWHRVEDMSSRGMDFHSVVLELSEAVRENRREKQVPAPRNLGQLTILTLHGSKGLEFPHVILLDFGAKPRASDTPLLFWDREKGAYLGSRDSEGERIKDNPVEAVWREEEKKKNLAESKRLFYVALTRARERVVLVCSDLLPGKQAFNPELAFGIDDWRGWIECSGWEFKSAKKVGKLLDFGLNADTSLESPAGTHSETQSEPNSIGPTKARSALCEILGEGPPLSRARHSVTELNLLSRCPRAYEWTYIRPVAAVSDEELGQKIGDDPCADLNSSVGAPPGEESNVEKQVETTHRELGNRIHKCLERRDFAGLEEIEAEVGSSRFLAEPLIRWALNSKWMLPVDLPRGRDVWAELSFEAPMGKEVLVGSMDRVVADKGDGTSRYAILDFKFTEKRKSVRGLLEAYQTQIELYAWALTVLDPSIRLEEIQAYLINISSETVQNVQVHLGKVNLEKLLADAVAIVHGRSGEPKPGPLCRMCGYRSSCAEGERYFLETQEAELERSEQIGAGGIIPQAIDKMPQTVF